VRGELILITLKSNQILPLFLYHSRHGSLNSLLGVANYFEQAGHLIYFSLKASWKGLIDNYNYHVELFNVEDEKESHDHQKGCDKLVAKYGSLFQKKTQTDTIVKAFFNHVLQFCLKTHQDLARIIQKVKPDLIIYNSIIPFPSVIASGITYINVESFNPKWLHSDCFELMRKRFEIEFDDATKWIFEKKINSKVLLYEHKSPFLNVCIYPNVFDLIENETFQASYFQLESALRKAVKEDLEVDISFVKPKDKLIYFTLGSKASADIELMKRLIQILGKSAHKYVVSKGPFHDLIDLEPNMVGSKYVDQIKLLPHVEMVITQGGSNTIIESLYFGKPVIVLPLFNDHFANAERIEKLFLGTRLNPYQVTEEDMLIEIESVLEDEDLNKRVAEIGKKMRSSVSGSKLVAFVEKAFQNKLNDDSGHSMIDENNIKH